MTNIILVGNPNTGKTTLFNALTGSNNHVGNWHGVTVDVACKKVVKNHAQYSFYDLPGIYSLKNFSPEEKVATEFLDAHMNDVVVNIVDANNLARNLLLTVQLMQKGYCVLLAVNMANENKNLDYVKLSRLLGIQVVAIDARKKSCSPIIFEALGNLKKSKNSWLNLTDNNQIFSMIDDLLSKCMSKPTAPYGISKLDKFLLNKWLALPIFLCVMLAVFAITFGSIGTTLSSAINGLFQFLAEKVGDLLLNLNVSAWAYALIINGIVGGIGVVVGFLPQVALLFLCMNFLEDVGYLSRVAIMFDGGMQKVGLSGKSLFSILLGFGCTTTALLTTRALDNVQLRKRTALVVPFASCSAKLPIYALICSAFFEKNKVLMVFLMYALGVILAVVVAKIANKITGKKMNNFVMELAPLRLPTLKKTFRNLLTNVWNFIKRVGTTLVICSLVVWIFSNLSFSFKYVSNVENSMLYQIANFVYPIFKPLGFSSPLVVVALIVGIVAKEMVVSCLAISNGVVGDLSKLAVSLALSTSAIHFSVPSAIGFLVFILLYSPCLSALSVMSKELGWKFGLFVFFFQFVLAYAGAYFAKLIATNIVDGKFAELAIVAIVLALLIFIVLKYKKKHKCISCTGGSCGDCMSKR